MYRIILEKIKKTLEKKNPPIILILGLRQTGKSTLAQTVSQGKPVIKFNFDLLSDINEFTRQNRHSLALFAKKYAKHILIIDEIQKSPEAVGIVKYFYDAYKLKILLTGSSEIKIRRGIGDSLAGRLWEFKLYPLTLEEINRQISLSFNPRLEFNNFEKNQQLLLRSLVFGTLPQLENLSPEAYPDYLNNLINGLLSKDLMEISGTKKPAQVFHLARLLAMQIGQIVNFNELAQSTELSRISIVNYVEIFKQMGLVVSADPISFNKREAITKRTKIYFTDLGIRNSLIGNFSDWEGRQDKGPLLENAVFIGMKRRLEYNGQSYELGFFRSEYGSEIDIVKKAGKKEESYEIKVGRKNNRKRKKVQEINLEIAQKYLY